MKRTKVLIGFLLVVFLLFIVSCSATYTGVQSKNDQEKRLTVSTSFYPIYIMTLNIVKDVPGVDLVNIAPLQTGCLHDYQMTANDLKKMENSDILVVNGAGTESFLDQVIEQLPELEIIEASRGLELINDNPHIWVGISGAKAEVENISTCLAELDPAYAELYLRNGNEYISRLKALETRMHQTLDGIANKKIITFHEAFPYFAREFGLETVAVIQREAGSEPGARELQETIELIKNTNVKAVFAEPQYSPLSAETIARETDARVYRLDPAVTGEMEADAYLKTMEKNMQVLFEALK